MGQFELDYSRTLNATFNIYLGIWAAKLRPQTFGIFAYFEFFLRSQASDSCIVIDVVRGWDGGGGLGGDEATKVGQVDARD